MEVPPLTIEMRISALELRLHFLMTALKELTDGLDELHGSVGVLLAAESSLRLKKAIKHADEPYLGKRRFII